MSHYTYYDDGKQVPKSVESVIIDSSVTEIGNDAFDGCTSLASIEIPKSVIAIGERAFVGCTCLLSIEIPDGVTSIGKWAFVGCTSLASIEIPKSVIALGERAFIRCTSLASIEIPDGITSIGDYAFFECTSLQSIEIPDGVTSIGDHAFQGCTSLASIEIPKSANAIGESAFQGCTSLASIEIPKSVTAIGDHAFAGCWLLQRYGGEDEVVSWLRNRFIDLPAHQVCYRSDVKAAKIKECLQEYPDSVERLDSLMISFFHVLLLNKSVTAEMAQVVLAKYPDAAKEIGPLGMYPLHLAIKYPRCATFSLIELLSSSYTRDGLLLLTVADESNSLPCALAIRHKLSDKIVLHLYERYPIKKSNLKAPEDGAILENICKQYITNLEKMSEADIESLNSVLQHGVVTLFVNGIESGSNVVQRCVKLINERPIQIVRLLAYFKDLQGRVTIESAEKTIRTALEKRMLFLGRFELDKGPVIHRSPTSVVIKAIDRSAEDEYRKAIRDALYMEKDTCNEQRSDIGKNGFISLLDKLGIPHQGSSLVDDLYKKWDLNNDGRISEEECLQLFKSHHDDGRPREVALKFMRITEQFQREVESRNNLNFESKHVIGISHAYSHDTDEAFAAALALYSKHGDVVLGDYKHMIVMPLADRSLDTIFRSEQPDNAKVRILARELAEAIAHVHSKGLIHGDVKLKNVVRFNSRLCLIDLDAAVEIDSPAGAKFSSGVLPPELFQELDLPKCKIFDLYFNEIKQDDADRWAKIESKKIAFGNGSKGFVVKTFLTKQKIVLKEQHGKTKKVSEYYPLDVELLPYTLVKARAAIDIWSFGAVLFSLVTGSSLFAVNRDDDLSDATAMKYLCEWNENKQKTKLEKINDPLAYKLLMKVLSPEPLNRYDSMEQLLRDDYFDAKNQTEHFVDYQKKIEDASKKHTVEIQNIGKATSAKASKSTSVILEAIFEATEVETPTCFVILPVKLPSICEGDTPGDRTEEYVRSTIDYVGYVLDKASDCIASPFKFAANFVKDKIIESDMFLYLVDESTGKPVWIDDEVYPIEIGVRSKQAKNFLPLMALGMRILASTNTAVGIITMFYPGVPSGLIPKDLLDKASRFIEESNKSGIIKQVVEQGSGNSKTVRGKDLREFVAFLKEKDPKRTFSGLTRICDRSSGKAMWVTNESAKKITDGNEAAHNRLTEENQQEVDAIGRLKATRDTALTRLRAEIKLLRLRNQSQAEGKCACAIL
jgi:serine/threonine protein kinase